MNREFVGAGPDLAYAFANEKYWPKVETVPALMPLSSFINSHLTNNDSAAMVVNGSVTPVEFAFVVPADKFFALSQLVLVLVDGAITATKFGGISALANGISILATDEDDVTQYDFHAGGPIKQNYEFNHIGGARISATSGADTIAVNWSSDLMGVYPVLSPGWKLKVIIRDNLAGIDSFEATCTGLYFEPDLVLST